MRANKAKRRWIKWCRYVDKTQTRSAKSGYGGSHVGHSKAYADAMYAHRWAPNGIRSVWFPRWATSRRQLKRWHRERDSRSYTALLVSLLGFGPGGEPLVTTRGSVGAMINLRSSR